MRLSDFISQNTESILQGWEDFARTLEIPGDSMSKLALRDHAALMLTTIAVDLRTPQSRLEQQEKSKGHAPKGLVETYAESHAAERLLAGFTINQLLSEYRALRASVLKLWGETSNNTLLTDPVDITRFNEAIDQALAESVSRFSDLTAERALVESERKDEFLAMLAHELRNPLAPISTAAQILTKAGVGEQHVRQAGDIITRQVKHMTSLVDDLLDLSRITRGLVQIAQEDLDLKLVLNNAVEQALPLIDSRKHALSIRMVPAAAFVKGDKNRLVQVVANMLNNAAKYTPQNGSIELVLDVEDKHARILVRDNGAGISAALLPFIFDLFTQGERTPDRAQGGLGLGLSLVKNITALHGGQVKAESDGIGCGSTFTVTLPLTKPVAEALQPAPQNSTLLTPITPLSLMIVDDNLDAAKSLADLLELDDHRVHVMEDAASALASPDKDMVQVFILDIGLPVMNGYELARRLRAEPSTSKAVLVALTGYGQAHDRVLTKTAGFDHHFVKPLDLNLLATVLQQVSSFERRGSM